MFGKKIREFDNSDGTVESFNRIFPDTPLQGTGHVEILGIADTQRDVYVRDVDINGVVVPFDFGKNNFHNTALMFEDAVRFKYTAVSLDNKILATAYNIRDLSEKLGCGESVVKNRLFNPIELNSPSRYLFNVTRTEI
jgi:hypothetical protein